MSCLIIPNRLLVWLAIPAFALLSTLRVSAQATAVEVNSSGTVVVPTTGAVNFTTGQLKVNGVAVTPGPGPTGPAGPTGPSR